MAPISVVRIWIDNNWAIYKNPGMIADIDYHLYHFKVAFSEDVKYRIFSFQFVDGKEQLLSHKIINDKVISEEYLYIHLQKRKMDFDRNIDWNNGFVICPNKFLPTNKFNYSVKEIKKLIGIGLFFKDKLVVVNRALFKIKRKLFIKK